eukprot:9468584-Pyramimonas_sp.AAC.1
MAAAAAAAAAVEDAEGGEGGGDVIICPEVAMFDRDNFGAAFPSGELAAGAPAMSGSSSASAVLGRGVRSRDSPERSWPAWAVGEVSGDQRDPDPSIGSAPPGPRSDGVATGRRDGGNGGAARERERDRIYV